MLPSPAGSPDTLWGNMKKKTSRRTLARFNLFWWNNIRKYGYLKQYIILIVIRAKRIAGSSDDHHSWTNILKRAKYSCTRILFFCSVYRYSELFEFWRTGVCWVCYNILYTGLKIWIGVGYASSQKMIIPIKHVYCIQFVCCQHTKYDIIQIFLELEHFSEPQWYQIVSWRPIDDVAPVVAFCSTIARIEI